MKNKEIIKIDEIQKKIYTIRAMQVMIDEDLALLYGVETKVLNQAVKRNIERFPKEFMFRITDEEYELLMPRIVPSKTDSLRSQNVTLNIVSLRPQFATLDSGRGKHRKYAPYAFTEQGVVMLSAVLRSETAIKMSIQIINAFVVMRRFMLQNAHDRFIIIDAVTVYHFGASLKDLGKKWFAFSKMEIGALELLEKVKG